MAEQLQMNGIGVAEMQHAALGEARRLMREAKGDRRVAAHLVYDLLVERGWLSDGERDVLVKMLEVGTAARGSADAQYREVRRMHDGLIVSGASPVALALASGVVGSYEPVDAGDGTVLVMAASKRNYQAVLGAAGAVIGGAFGGGLGAAAGGAIGGVIGYIVDDCKD
ncbi:hypothetical protein [Arthrobacter sp. JSM 101049]|uniref:hypothetical protein n=1 Tax=Arthrobacter sp. JSM 101049 TaxID=929097 RepID=UPI003568CFC1